MRATMTTHATSAGECASAANDTTITSALTHGRIALTTVKPKQLRLVQSHAAPVRLVRAAVIGGP